MKVKKTVSAAVLDKNRANSKKSTGPTSPEGKNTSRFNALKHGLTARHVMFDRVGKPLDNHLVNLVEALREQYGADDIIGELLIDNIAVDCWRQEKGFEAEVRYLSRDEWAFQAQGSLMTIQRYNTSNRRALLKNIELLKESQVRSAEVPASEDLVPAMSECEESVRVNRELGTQTPEDLSCNIFPFTHETLESVAEHRSAASLPEGDGASEV